MLFFDYMEQQKALQFYNEIKKMNIDLTFKNILLDNIYFFTDGLKNDYGVKRNETNN